MKTFLHVGYPKSASSWLQRHYFVEKNNFINLMNYGEWANYIGNELLTAQTTIFKDERPELPPNEKTEENVVGISYEGIMDGIFNTDIQLIIDRTKKILGDPKVLMIIREQRSLVYANYIQYLRSGYSKNPNTYLKEIRWNKQQSIYGRLDYNKMYQLLKANFSDVLVIPLEKLKQDRKACIRTLNAYYGSEWSEVNEERTNASCPDSEVKMMHILNKLFKRGIGRSYMSLLPTSCIIKGKAEMIGEEDEVDRMGRWIPYIASEIGPRIFRNIGQSQKKKFRERNKEIFYKDFAEGNRKISKELNLELDQYGYLN